MKVTILTVTLAAASFGADSPLVNLTPHNANTENRTYHGRAALKITAKDGRTQAWGAVPAITFRDGTIDVDVAGAPVTGAADAARGFIGVLFRQQNDPGRFELIYIRPTNGRSDDQLRRNHAVQYTSEPEWPWERLRRETPGVYESYADMQAGEWIHMRIVVKGRDAALYVGNAEQPCLLVHDLKHGESEGTVALWVGGDTEGYFTGLRIAR